jgi:hypothetical protein
MPPLFGAAAPGKLSRHGGLAHPGNLSPLDHVAPLGYSRVGSDMRASVGAAGRLRCIAVLPIRCTAPRRCGEMHMLWPAEGIMIPAGRAGDWRSA